jgi:hypothetical protein
MPATAPKTNETGNRQQGMKAKIGYRHDAVAAHGQEPAMGEVDDLHDAEDDEETGGHDVQDGRRGYDVENMGHHD